MYSDDVEILLNCFSEKENAGFGFGYSIELDNIPLDVNGNYNLLKIQEMFWEEYFDIFVMQESFWENYHEFENGLAKAHTVLERNNQLTLRQTLFDVFGHFQIIFNINGDEVEPEESYISEIEDCVYSMLESIEV